MTLPCIYFAGSDSTGKSALVRSTALAYNLPRVHEGARAELEEQGLTLASLRTKSQTADDYQRAVFERQLKLEAATQRPFVADRGLLDNLSYACLHARCFHELAHRKEVLDYTAKQRHDIVFLVRPQKALRAEDGVRILPSWEDQQRIDAMIEMLLKLHNVPFVPICESNAAAREDLIDWCMKARGHVKAS